MTKSLTTILREPIVLGDAVRAAIDWWKAEFLKAIDFSVPSYLREKRLNISAAFETGTCRLRDSAGDIELESESDPAGSHEVRARLQRIVEQRKLDGVDATLLIASQDSVQKRISLPVAARDGVLEAARYQIDLETPFREEDVYFGAKVLQETSSSLLVELAIARKDRVDAQISWLESCGARVSRLAFGGASGTGDIEVIREQAPNRPGRSTGPLIVGSIVALLAILAAAAPLGFKFAEVRSLAATVERDRNIAMPLIAKKRSLDARFAQDRDIATALLQYPDPLEIFATLTRTIPTNAWLTRLSMRSGEIQITGLAPSTSQLIDRIAATGLFDMPAYAAPAVPDMASGMERYVLNIQLKPSL
jgi:general secretion pathway protein L